MIESHRQGIIPCAMVIKFMTASQLLNFRWKVFDLSSCDKVVPI